MYTIMFRWRLSTISHGEGIEVKEDFVQKQKSQRLVLLMVGGLLTAELAAQELLLLVHTSVLTSVYLRIGHLVKIK